MKEAVVSCYEEGWSVKGPHYIDYTLIVACFDLSVNYIHVS